MSIKPLLNPASVENKSLDLYCNSITTSSGSGGDVITYETHINVGGYLGDNPINPALIIIADNKQLTRQSNKYVNITGKLTVQFSVNTFDEFRLTFDSPVNGVIDALFVVGSGVIPPTATAGAIYASGVGFNNNQINIRFDKSTGAVLPVVPINNTLTYSIVLLLQ